MVLGEINSFTKGHFVSGLVSIKLTQTQLVTLLIVTSSLGLLLSKDGPHQTLRGALLETQTRTDGILNWTMRGQMNHDSIEVSRSVSRPAETRHWMGLFCGHREEKVKNSLESRGDAPRPTVRDTNWFFCSRRILGCG